MTREERYRAWWTDRKYIAGKGLGHAPLISPRTSGAFLMSGRKVTMTTHARPVTDDQREAARKWIDDRAEDIKLAKGYVFIRRYDAPQPQWGIHEITGLMVQRMGGELMRVCLRERTVGLVSALIADEFAARLRYEQPMTSSVPWRHMSPQLRRLVFDASILPTEWKSEQHLSDDYLNSRVRLHMATPVLHFLQA